MTHQWENIELMEDRMMERMFIDEEIFERRKRRHHKVKFYKPSPKKPILDLMKEKNLSNSLLNNFRVSVIGTISSSQLEFLDSLNTLNQLNKFKWFYSDPKSNSQVRYATYLNIY